MSLHESAREALANADAALVCELTIALIYEDDKWDFREWFWRSSSRANASQN